MLFFCNLNASCSEYYNPASVNITGLAVLPLKNNKDIPDQKIN